MKDKEIARLQARSKRSKHGRRAAEAVGGGRGQAKDCQERKPASASLEECHREESRARPRSRRQRRCPGRGKRLRSRRLKLSTRRSNVFSLRVRDLKTQTIAIRRKPKGWQSFVYVVHCSQTSTVGIDGDPMVIACVRRLGAWRPEAHWKRAGRTALAIKNLFGRQTAVGPVIRCSCPRPVFPDSHPERRFSAYSLAIISPRSTARPSSAMPTISSSRIDVHRRDEPYAVQIVCVVRYSL